METKKTIKGGIVHGETTPKAQSLLVGQIKRLDPNLCILNTMQKHKITVQQTRWNF